MSYARRTDTTHREVIDTLRQCGWKVADTHALPNWVDCVASRGDAVRLIEIKAPKGKLKPSQQRLMNDGWPIVVLRSAEDAARLR